ncbi:exodeoxyribonuclease VII small subunit [Cohnella algarum]|uniref:exodeoxyribonuclease VII small subunit n=1 Tax=Cohnella algarum TaxID=2044859 RepID=UPI003B8381A0
MSLKPERETAGAETAASADAAQAISFEEAMEKLEEIVARLEHSDVPLETAIELYQQGIALSRLCGRSSNKWKKGSKC